MSYDIPTKLDRWYIRFEATHCKYHTRFGRNCINPIRLLGLETAGLAVGTLFQLHLQAEIWVIPVVRGRYVKFTTFGFVRQFLH